MAVNLSPIWGAGAQLLDNSGNVLSGGKIYTYAAGTTTQVATYTSNSGVTANSNPIVLNSAGRVPYEIWLTDGQNYKFVLKDSNDVLIGTWDNLSGINSNFIAYTNEQEIQTATAGQTVFNLTTMQYLTGTNSLSVFVDGVNQYGPGAQYAYEETDSTTITFASGLHVGAEVKFTSSQIQNAGVADASQIGYTYPATNAVSESVEDRLAQYVSVQDFGAVGDGVTDDTQAFINALSASNTINGEAGKTYLISSSITVSNNKTLIGNGATLKGSASITCFLVTGNDVTVKGWNVQANGALYVFSNRGNRNTYIENKFSGNVGHYIFDNAGTKQTKIINNNVNGNGQDLITTSFVLENSKSFTVTNNTFVDIENWCIQTRTASDGVISNNNCFASQYTSTVTATAGQTVFNFTLSNPCHLAGIQVDGLPVDTGITFSPVVPAPTPTTNWTVTFNVAPGAGKVVKLVAYRAAENIQVNNTSTNISVIGNVCDGSGDSGIIVAGLSSLVTISGNTIKNISYTGVSIEGGSIYCSVTGNIIQNTSLVTNAATYSSGILVGGEWNVISDNVIVNTANPNTMNYGISVNTYAADDGTNNASIKIGPNIYKSSTQPFDVNIFMPNEDIAQRRQDVLILDGVTTQYPEQLNLDSAWTNAPANTNYFTNTFFGTTGAIRDTSTIQGGVASLKTVAGEYVDINPTADGILKNTVVNVTFWAKNNSGSSYVTVFLDIGGGFIGSPGVTVTDTNWRQYSLTFPITNAIVPSGCFIRVGSNTGYANFQYFQISMMNFA